MTSPAKRAIVIGMDGASMELVKHMVAWGHVPSLKRLLVRGVHRPMIGVFPTLTPPGWTALSTGSWPGTHGVLDFNIRALGQPLTETTWGINTRLARSEYLWNAAERAGRRPILVKWEMAWPPTVTTGVQVEGTGPGVSNHHQIAGYHLFVGGKWAPRPIGGARDPETLDPSALQEGAPVDVVVIGRPMAGATCRRRPTAAGGRAPRAAAGARARHHAARALRDAQDLHRSPYATGDGGYDRLRVAAGRDAGEPLAELAVGQWSDWRRDAFEIDGAPVEGAFKLKLITLTPEADQFELLVTQIWPTGGDWAAPAGVAEEITQAVGPFVQNPLRDALGLFDDDTYFELLDEHHRRLGEVAVHLATRGRGICSSSRATPPTTPATSSSARPTRSAAPTPRPCGAAATGSPAPTPRWN